jgi:hypothetical protein
MRVRLNQSKEEEQEGDASDYSLAATNSKRSFASRSRFHAHRRCLMYTPDVHDVVVPTMLRRGPGHRSRNTEKETTHGSQQVPISLVSGNI